MNHDYLEAYAWKILGPRYIGDNVKTLAERIDVEQAIQRSLEEREALYMKLKQCHAVVGGLLATIGGKGDVTETADWQINSTNGKASIKAVTRFYF